jgi:carbon-monoxide dehydrogenase medium subunit
MKAATFALDVPVALADVSSMLSKAGRIIAGGQSLGPMLNMRVAQPERLVSIRRLTDLCGVTETESHVVIGACVTHAMIADGLVPDIGQSILPRIAESIAYRAVRNRGTIGGSLCHADPAADWVTTLLALDAEALTFAPDGGRAIRLRDFFAGAFRTVLVPGEFLRAVRIQKLRPAARWGYFKACRKPGEFAHSMAAVFEDAGLRRVVIGAMGTVPLVFEGAETEPDAIVGALKARAPELDDVALHMQRVVLRRADERARE